MATPAHEFNAIYPGDKFVGPAGVREILDIGLWGISYGIECHQAVLGPFCSNHQLGPKGSALKY